MEEFSLKEVKGDIKTLEGRVSAHDVKIAKVEESHGFIKSMAEDVVNTTKGLNDTMQQIQITMTSMAINLKDLANDMKKANGRLDGFEEEINLLKEKNTIDISETIKKHWLTIVLAITFVTYFIFKEYGFKI